MKISVPGALALTFSIVFSHLVLAAGGGPVGGGSTAGPMEQKSSREIAIENYNSGLKNRDKAWKLLEQARQEPDAKKATRLEGKVNKEFESAAGRFRKAIKAEPTFYQAHASLGYALRKLGNYKESIAAYNQSLTIKPDYTEAIEYRGEAYLAIGDLEATKGAYIRLMQLDRPRADELMAAFKSFIEHPPANVDQALLSAFRIWVDERIQLSMATRDLSDTPAQDWSPN